MSTVHTQATNFTDFIKTGVDPRTGQFTLAFQLPLIPANNMCGPSLSPTLAFNVMGSTQDKGFGLGWSLDLTELNLNQDAPSLYLSSGESFAVDTDIPATTPGSELKLLDAKLKSMVVTRLNTDTFLVEYKNGQSELLSRQEDSTRFLVTEIRSPEGRRIHVRWSPFRGGFRLRSIRDETRILLRVAYEEGEIEFSVPGRDAQALRMRTTNDKLVAVHLPGIKTPCTITYDHYPLDGNTHLLLPTEFITPLGASDTVTWAKGEDGHQLPDGAPFKDLPRVLRRTHSSGADHTKLHRTYVWIGAHNFLGYGSAQAFDWQKGRDNLYQVEQDYSYSVVETQTDSKRTPLSVITRNWNRFHLLTREISRRGHCEIRQDTTYGVVPDTRWSDQPAWCQLPHKQTVTFIDHSAANLKRSEDTEYRYDSFGNVLFTRTPNGIEEHSEYYPAEGDEDAKGCPASPLGIVRFLKKKTIKPLRLADDTYGGASQTSTTYTYKALDSLIDGGRPFVVVDSETAEDDTRSRKIESTVQTYIAERGPHYARIASKVTTLNDKATTTRYDYELTDSEVTTRTTIIGFENTDQVRSTQSSTRSLATGQVVREVNEAAAVSSYEYDNLGRVTLVVSAAASPYETRSATTYHVRDKVALKHVLMGENPVMIEHLLATGQHRRQWLDGEGRTVRVELEDLDHAAGTFREIARTRFDAEGRTISETQWDWLRDPDNGAVVTPLKLTTDTLYDDWGHVSQSIPPNGVVSHSQLDPVKRVLKTWQQNGTVKGPHTLTRHNAAGSAIQAELYDTDGTLIRASAWLRDGLDRVTRTTVSVPGQPDRVSTVKLDVYGRPTEQQLADATVVHWTYAPHSDGNHPQTIAVTPPAPDGARQ
jgi:hypothetical protein